MIERVLIPVTATFLSLGFFLAGLIAVALVLLNAAIPCSPEGLFYTITRFVAVIALFTGAVVMEPLKFAPCTRKFMIGLAVPLLAVGLHAIAMQKDAAAQRACLAQRDSG
jgi:hypothetical protein